MRLGRALPKLAVALTIGTLALSTSAVADGPITVGQTAKFGDLLSECTGSALYVQSQISGGTSYVAPADGVVVAWSIYSDTGQGIAQFKLAHEGPANNFQILYSAPRRQLTAVGLNTFPARIPIKRGDTPALFTPDANSVACFYLTGASGDVLRAKASSEPLDGALVPTSPVPGYRLDLSLQVEPDADQDGYGDLTQDACPSRADRQHDCAAPETTVKAPKKVRTTKKTAKVKVSLGSEPGATFVCVVDGGRAKPCAAKVTVKLRLGTHHLVVAATDLFANTDRTPATATIKVVPKR